MKRRKQLILIGLLLLSLCSVFSIRYVDAQCEPSWNTLESPNPGLSNNQFNGIAALSARDAWAVGVYVNQATNRFENLAMHWDGTQWSITPTPNPASGTNQLKKVAAISSDDVWAVGGHGLTYALHWDGSLWNVVKTPNPNIQNYLDDIAAVASNDVWAVGSMATPDGSVNTLTTHWNGESWTQVASPNVPFPDRTGFYPSYLNGLTVVSANDVWAVGQYRVGNILFPLIEHWNGQTWTIVSSPNGPTGDGRLWAISAVSGTDIWAVGDYGISDFNSWGSALAMHWDGRQWTTVNMPQPSSFGVSPVFRITALSANDAWAVGDWETDAQGMNTFIAHWDGSVWSQVTTPDIPGTGTGWNTLKDIVVISASDILAAGWKQASFGAPYTTLVERYRDQCISPSSVGVSSLTINPSSVVGGRSSQGTVTLSGVAPQGGAQVALSSNNVAVALTDASVAIPAGARSASFNVSTSAVSSSDTALVTASWNGSALQTTITVTPAVLSSLALSPASVAGGAASQATVSLDGPAPAKGAVITLVSSNTAAATVPQSVAIPAGATSVSFNVTTRSVTTSASALISASLGGVTKSATLSVAAARVAPATDTVTISRAEYTASKRELRLEVTGSNASATMKVFTTTGSVIGTLTKNGSSGKYAGQFSWPTNPQSVTVKSSLGGSATRAVR